MENWIRGWNHRIIDTESDWQKCSHMWKEEKKVVDPTFLFLWEITREEGGMYPSAWSMMWF